MRFNFEINCGKSLPVMFLSSVLSLAACSEKSETPATAAVVSPVDTVLINGGVYTVNAHRNWVEAVAIRDGEIVAVGTNFEIEKLLGPETQVIDLDGRMALPGFHDVHVHPLASGYALLGCNLESEFTVEDLIAQVGICAENQPDGPLEGFAFDLGLFGPDGPHKSLLDAIDSSRAIILWGSDGHAAWANSKALELAGINADSADPELGVIERDPDGSPSGTLRETAQELVRLVLPPNTLESNVQALSAGVQHLNRYGVTSFIEAIAGLEDYQAYLALDQAGGLTARVVTSLVYKSGFTKHQGQDWEDVLVSRNDYESGRISHDSIKLFLDGVLEGETAALTEDYLGLHHKGELILGPDELAAAVSRFDALGLQVHMHAIGDRAVQAGLDAVETAREQNGIRDNRHHISHLQLIHKDDIGRFAELGVTANFQAFWAWPDEWILELNQPVLGEERVQSMYPIASVARAGGRIAGGSDWNVSSANPLDAIEVALRRQDADATGGPVLNEAERVDLAMMIDAYTINGAWLMHQEDQVGSIRPGKRADIVILDRNLFEIPHTEINEAQIEMTLVDGEIVWSDKAGMDSE